MRAKQKYCHKAEINTKVANDRFCHDRMWWEHKYTLLLRYPLIFEAGLVKVLSPALTSPASKITLLKAVMYMTRARK